MSHPRGAAAIEAPDSRYAWLRLLAALAIATIGGIGLWSAVVILPTIELEFGVGRGGASLPYTATMIGFAAGGVMMGRLADRRGIMVPLYQPSPSNMPSADEQLE